MRFISMVKSAEGGAPRPELMQAIGHLAHEMAQKGVLVEMGGLAPSAKGARMRLARGAWKRRLGTALSTVAVLFLLFDGTGKLLKVAPVVEGSAQLGYPEDLVRALGVILTLCVATYVNPRSAVVGAVLLTGYLGGAVATHLRVGSPLLTHVLFPVYVALFVWGGLLLRDARLSRLWQRQE